MGSDSGPAYSYGGVVLVRVRLEDGVVVRYLDFDCAVVGSVSVRQVLLEDGEWRPEGALGGSPFRVGPVGGSGV